MVKNGLSAALIVAGAILGGESGSSTGGSCLEGESGYDPWFDGEALVDSINDVNMGCDEDGESSEDEK
jgi:hypothetical protein